MSDDGRPRQRLSGPEIGLLRYLARIPGFVYLPRKNRARIVPLVRRGVVYCLYRQEMASDRSLRGPYFQLSPFGQQLARAFVRADDIRRAKGSPT